MRSIHESISLALFDLFGGRHEDLSTQPRRTALSAAICHYLAELDLASDGEYQLWGSPHSMETIELLRAHKIEHVHYEFLNDFTIFRQSSDCTHTPILACESEVHEQHSISNDLNSGYAWDFRKLLFTAFPQKVFVGCVNESRGSDSIQRLDALKETLSECAREYRSVWEYQSLSIFIYPSAARNFNSAWIGYSTETGGIEWQRLGSRQKPIS